MMTHHALLDMKKYLRDKTDEALSGIDEYVRDGKRARVACIKLGKVEMMAHEIARHIEARI